MIYTLLGYPPAKACNSVTMSTHAILVNWSIYLWTVQKSACFFHRQVRCECQEDPDESKELIFNDFLCELQLVARPRYDLLCMPVYTRNLCKCVDGCYCAWAYPSHFLDSHFLLKMCRILLRKSSTCIFIWCDCRYPDMMVVLWSLSIICRKCLSRSWPT